MKKAISLLLAFVVCLFLCACGGANDAPSTTETPQTPTETNEQADSIMTKEEMLESAEEVSLSQLNDDSSSNFSDAKQRYCGKILKLQGEVKGFSQDGDFVSLTCGGDFDVIVYMSSEEMSTLKRGQQIIVVGQMAEELDGYLYQMPLAYLVQDRFEVTGTVQGTGVGIIIEDIDGILTIHWAEGIDYKQYAWQQVTISSICINENTGLSFYDATVVE